MSCLIQLKTHPFRLLLYVEWTLLGIAVLAEWPWDSIPYLGTLLGGSSVPSQLLPFAPLVMILCILVFGLMGLWLPTTSQTISKLLYTALELGLIWLAVALGGWEAQFVSLYVIVVIRNCLIFKDRGRLLIVGLVFLSFVLTLLISFQDTRINHYLEAAEQFNPARVKFLISILTINITFYFGLVSVFVMLLVTALLSESQSRQKLAIAHDQLQKYALRIEDQATLQERNRIAREIHDSLGHALTAQSIQLENALLFCPATAQKTQAFLTEAKQLGSKALKDVRQSVSALRHNPLHERSLESAIATLVQDFHAMSSIVPDCTIDLSHPVTPEVSTNIYRIVQEALTNIYKHSAAAKVTIHLQAKDALLHLLVADDGKGFNPEQNTTGFGLQGMRERTAALGGSFQIVSVGVGCRVSVEIPLINLVP